MSTERENLDTDPIEAISLEKTSSIQKSGEPSVEIVRLTASNGHPGEVEESDTKAFSYDVRSGLDY